MTNPKPIAETKKTLLELMNSLYPDGFTSKQFCDSAKDVPWTISTARTYLSRWLHEGCLYLSKDKYYVKPSYLIKSTALPIEASTSTAPKVEEAPVAPVIKSKPSSSVTVVSISLKDFDTKDLMGELYRRGFTEGWEHLVYVETVRTPVSITAVREAAKAMTV